MATMRVPRQSPLPEETGARRFSLELRRGCPLARLHVRVAYESKRMVAQSREHAAMQIAETRQQLRIRRHLHAQPPGSTSVVRRPRYCGRPDDGTADSRKRRATS